MKPVRSTLKCPSVLWVALIIILVSGFGYGAFMEGKEYKKLSVPQVLTQPEKMEVIEFFWYGCAHCYWLEPDIAKWEATLPADTVFRRVHVAWPGRHDMDGHAKLFTTLQFMGIEGKYRKAIFEAIQNQHIELRKEAILFDWVKKHGIDLDTFKANYYSFTTNVAVNKLRQMTEDYQISSVPIFVVNGKYFTDSVMSGDTRTSIVQVINTLLEMDRKKKQTDKASKKQKA